jgi:hypothetical protein
VSQFQADYQCDGVNPDGRPCGSWYRVFGDPVVCNMCGKIDERGGRLAAEKKPWMEGKPAFGMGWNKKQHRVTMPGRLQ